jgi:hypothetical protein
VVLINFGQYRRGTAVLGAPVVSGDGVGLGAGSATATAVRNSTRDHHAIGSQHHFLSPLLSPLAGQPSLWINGIVPVVRQRRPNAEQRAAR